ncbi:MAG TPA: hypothetical protein VM347_07935, partial [Nonomuraea sp.]|nr:hypothetical protein [Nonomuraea sp.]
MSSNTSTYQKNGLCWPPRRACAACQNLAVTSEPMSGRRRSPRSCSLSGTSRILFFAMTRPSRTRCRAGQRGVEPGGEQERAETVQQRGGLVLLILRVFEVRPGGVQEPVGPRQRHDLGAERLALPAGAQTADLSVVEIGDDHSVRLVRCHLKAIHLASVL